MAQLPAGPLGFAAGYEYRKYEGAYRPDPITVAGEYNGVPSGPTSGEYDVNEIYAELAVPLAHTGAFTRVLEAVVASPLPARIAPERIDVRHRDGETFRVVLDIEDAAERVAWEAKTFSELGAAR